MRQEFKIYHGHHLINLSHTAVIRVTNNATIIYYLHIKYNFINCHEADVIIQ